jgi:hypothetical protein
MYKAGLCDVPARGSKSKVPEVLSAYRFQPALVQGATKCDIPHMKSDGLYVVKKCRTGATKCEPSTGLYLFMWSKIVLRPSCTRRQNRRTSLQKGYNKYSECLADYRKPVRKYSIGINDLNLRSKGEYRTQVRKAYGTSTARVWELGYRPKVSDSARPTTAVSEFSPCDVLGYRFRPNF